MPGSHFSTQAHRKAAAVAQCGPATALTATLPLVTIVVVVVDVVLQKQQLLLFLSSGTSTSSCSSRSGSGSRSRSGRRRRRNASGRAVAEAVEGHSQGATGRCNFFFRNGFVTNVFASVPVFVCETVPRCVKMLPFFKYVCTS